MYNGTSYSNNHDGFCSRMEIILKAANVDSYSRLFREQNISVQDLADFSDLDLIILGMNSPEDRKNLLDQIKLVKMTVAAKFAQDEAPELTKEIARNMIVDINKQLNRILLNLKLNIVNLSSRTYEDVLLRSDDLCYTSDVILDCFNHTEGMLDKMETSLKSLNKIPSTKSKQRRRKLVIGVIGGSCIIVLAISLVKSLKNL